MKALNVHAGPHALQALREHGLQPQHVRVIPAAAGGPKGLVPRTMPKTRLAVAS